MKHNLDLKKLFELAFENHKNGNLPVAEKFYKQNNHPLLFLQIMEFFLQSPKYDQI